SSPGSVSSLIQARRLRHGTVPEAGPVSESLCRTGAGHPPGARERNVGRYAFLYLAKYPDRAFLKQQRVAGKGIFARRSVTGRTNAMSGRTLKTTCGGDGGPTACSREAQRSAPDRSAPLRLAAAPGGWVNTGTPGRR